jgi:hypothetical protein
MLGQLQKHPMPEGRMNMPRGPFLKTGRTPKQELWLQKTVEYNGNGVQAARDVYDRTPQSAYAIASQNFNHPRIRPDLEKAFLAHGVTPDKLAGTIGEALNARKSDEADHAVRFTAVRVATKILQADKVKEQRSIRIEMLSREPLEVQRFIAENGRLPNAEERARLLSPIDNGEGESDDSEIVP